MTVPTLLPRWVQRLAPADRAEVVPEHEERAAIREFDGGAVRFQAEIVAWDDVSRWYEREAQGAPEGARRIAEAL